MRRTRGRVDPRVPEGIIVTSINDYPLPGGGPHVQIPKRIKRPAATVILITRVQPNVEVNPNRGSRELINRDIIKLIKLRVARVSEVRSRSMNRANIENIPAVKRLKSQDRKSVV